jgi:hypothetical protein
LPEDLEDGDTALLALLAPLIPQTALRARVGDAAWFYGRRADQSLLRYAVDARGAEPGWEGNARADG